MEEAYGQGPVAPPEQAPEPAETPESVDEENAEQAEVVVANSVLTGPDGKPPKEGDEIVVKVVKNYGDESSIIYAPPKTETETQTESSPEEEIAALDTERT